MILKIIVHQVEHFILVKVFFLNSKILDAVFFFLFFLKDF